MPTYEYPRPGFTADIAVICNEKVLLIQRKFPPFVNSLVLPGGFVDEGETSRQAAIRELQEETGLVVTKEDEDNFHFVRLFDSPGRDPRGWTISALYLWYFRGPELPEVFATDEAKDFCWKSVYDCEGLGFDHDSMVAVSHMEWMECKSWDFEL